MSPKILSIIFIGAIGAPALFAEEFICEPARPNSNPTEAPNANDAPKPDFGVCRTKYQADVARCDAEFVSGDTIKSVSGYENCLDLAVSSFRVCSGVAHIRRITTGSSM